MSLFYVGQRVKRLADPFDDSSAPLYRTGTVILQYDDLISKFRTYPELYEVEWDDGQIEKGFLPHGLQPL